MSGEGAWQASAVPVFVVLPGLEGQQCQKRPQKQIAHQGGVVNAGRQTPIGLRPHQDQQCRSQDQKLPDMTADFAILVLGVVMWAGAHGLAVLGSLLIVPVTADGFVKTLMCWWLIYFTAVCQILHFLSRYLS